MVAIPMQTLAVGMGFLYSEVMREQLGPKETEIFKKGMAPCLFGTSVVNCI